ncbi:ATP-binding cassette domain-containing protein [Lysinibacillus sp. KU-BSD001]|uniref:ABC transporter ATP-binding protein n=1 Tax=Lysinibacillus sp. KU-BSD001 TaxID=3141328 RepID=UPI0036E67F51
MNSIEVNNLRKKYGNYEAVKGISFSVKKGALFAFLGTNGAGKSTTIEILCTLTQKTAGEVTIAGQPLKNQDAIRKEIGVVFQQSILDSQLSVYENIMHRGNMYKLTKTTLQENYAFVSHYLQLADIEHKKYGCLSGGQKRRADIARALIHKPSILFLDEPTTGLDPQTRIFVWEAIKKLQQETDMTIFLTTHYMEEAAVADDIVIIKQGEIVAQGTPHALKDQYAFDQMTLLFKDQTIGEQYLQNQNLTFQEKNGVYYVRIRSTIDALHILKELEENLASFEVIKGSMDDVFMCINEEGVAI